MIGMLILILFIQPKNYLSFRKFGDISYGVYIFHFPIIQLFVANVGFDKYPVAVSFAAVFLTYVLAFISWHLLEKRMLNFKKEV